MAVTVENSGTQTATVGTEHFVEDTNVSGVFTFEVDRNAMVDGDVLELRVYKIILTAGASRELFYQMYDGAPDAAHPAVVVSEAVSNDLTDATALRFSLKQIEGAAGRAFPWKVLKHN